MRLTRTPTPESAPAARGGRLGVALRWGGGDAPRAVIVAVVVFVFAFSLWQNVTDVSKTRFHPDESRWINRAHYLKDYLHPFSSTWEDQYLIRGQPPFGSYVTGLGLLVQGRDLNTNNPWDFHRGDEWNVNWNVVYGSMPARDDLEAARRTNSVIGAISAALLTLIVIRLSNVVGGLIGGLFMALHPLQINLSTLGVADAPFTLVVALATLAIMALADRATWPRAILLGVLLGLGSSAKLSPLFLSVGIAAVGGALLCDRQLRRLPKVGRLWGTFASADTPRGQQLGWMLLVQPVIAFAVFVVSYPYLWPDPLRRTKDLLDFRQEEMESQARIWQDRAIDNRFEAFRRVWDTFENDYSTTGRMIASVGSALGRTWDASGYDVPFVLIGLAIFAVLVMRRGLVSRHGMAAVLLGGQAATILAGLRVDFNRYYLPMLLLVSLGIGLLAAQIWSALPRLIPALQTPAGETSRRAFAFPRPRLGTARGETFRPIQADSATSKHD